MRNLFWQMSVTLDGFMEGPNHELDDTAGFKDEDFDRYATEMLKSIDGMLIGRRLMSCSPAIGRRRRVKTPNE